MNADTHVPPAGASRVKVLTIWTPEDKAFWAREPMGNRPKVSS